jgi:ApaG protein
MTKKTYNISVQTQPSYVPAQSDPAHHKFLWSYEITIHNDSEDIVQLLNRRWIITDLSGRMEQIQGPGVVGLQPMIKPGKKFVYVSYCQLLTPQGTMEGSFEMQNLEEEHFNVDIPKFVLSAPSSVTKLFKSKLH